MKNDKIEVLINSKKWDDIVKNYDINKPLYNNNYLIHYAGYNNDAKLFNKLIKKKVNILKKNIDGNTIAHICYKFGYIDLLKKVIKYNPNVISTQNTKGNTILHLIINREPNYDLFDNIITKYKKDVKKAVNTTNIYKMTILIMLLFDVKNGIKYDLIEKILELDPDMTIPIEAPPLILATKLDNFKLVKLFVNHRSCNDKSCVNVISKSNTTPLLEAIMNNNLEIVKYLLDSGANYNYYDDMGNLFVFFVALRLAKSEIILLLLKYDIDMNFKNKYLDAPGHYVFMSQPKKFSLDIKKKVLEKSCLLHQNTNGNTILHYIFKYHNWKDYKNILEHKKMDIFITNKNKKSVCEMSSKNSKFLDTVVKSYLRHSDVKKSKHEIKTIILKAKQSYPSKDDSSVTTRSQINLNFTTKKYASYNKSNAGSMDNYVYMVYILDKYNNLTIPHYKTTDFQLPTKTNNGHVLHRMVKRVVDNIDQLYFATIIWKNKSTYFVPNNFKKAFEQARKNNDYVFIRLSIVLNKFNHANILLYDKSMNTMERFDPYGAISQKKEEMKSFDKMLKKLFPGIKYLKPCDYMNMHSFQSISDETNIYNLKTGDLFGYCLAWCFWYIELRLSNELVDQKQLVDKSIKKITNADLTFKEFIRNYANALVDYKTDLLLRAGIDKKKVYNRYFKKDELEKIYKLLKIKYKKLL
jgi:ankyrin repeat protein